MRGRHHCQPQQMHRLVQNALLKDVQNHLDLIEGLYMERDCSKDVLQKSSLWEAALAELDRQRLDCRTMGRLMKDCLWRDLQ